jgi:putative DNA primase/helicase
LLETITENLEKRAASVFAIIGLAGELGIEYDLLPWKPGSALAAVQIAFSRWRKFQGAAQTEDQKILQSISNFIDKHGNSRFSTTTLETDEKIIHDRAGWCKIENNKRVYMFTSEGLLEAANGYDRTRIIDTLVRYKWLIDKDSDRHSKKTRFGAETKNLYHIQIPDDGETAA